MISEFNPLSPLIPCYNLPMDFVDCEEPLDLKNNVTLKNILNHGCLKFGGQTFEEVEKTIVNCTVLSEIECSGKRSFIKKNVPCIKYTGHYFLTTLLYSIFLGILGIDRFVLGHTRTAVAKLLTFGGLGFWWLLDVVLLVTGNLLPEDGSNFNIRS